jgi:serine kinase of HPr protein (carbohydrate metabolism regulator)
MWMKTKKPNIHGNLVQINQQGILILGSPGTGKSTLTLDLLNRGYFFISDDLISLRFESNNLIGYRPESPARMHTREHGFLDLDLLFPTQILSFSPIHFILDLNPPPSAERFRNFKEYPPIFEALKQIPYLQKTQISDA